MSVVAVVPAKASSRRVPGKNLRLLGGLPMLCHSINVARATKGIDFVLVSSDVPNILALATQHGATALARPLELCTDDATNFQVIQHAVAALRADGIDPSVVALLQPTTPFRTAGPLADMLRRFQADTQADSLVTVVAATRLRGTVDGGCWIPDSVTVGANQRMKAQSARHELTGHVFLLRPARTLDCGTLIGERVLAADLPQDWLDIDVDTPNDWFIAEQVAAKYFGDGFRP